MVLSRMILHLLLRSFEMKDVMEAVGAFHEQMGFPINGRLKEDTARGSVITNQQLDALHKSLSFQASSIFELACQESAVGDRRMMRMHLMLEELSELAVGLKEHDEVAVADAIGDLTYVVAGTGIVYGLPMETVFNEIQRSNMTKTGGGFHPKGDDYSPPNIQRAIDEGRVKEDWCSDDQVELG